MAKMLAKANPGWPGECKRRHCRCHLYFHWGEMTPKAHRARRRSQRFRERDALRRTAAEAVASRD